LGQRKEVILAPPFIVSMSPPSYPSAWLRPRSAASVSPGKIIVAPPQLNQTTAQSDTEVLKYQTFCQLKFALKGPVGTASNALDRQGIEESKNSGLSESGVV
jgi:hypothetical protein